MKYLKNVVTLKYNSEKCTGCRRCIEVCPRTVFEMEDKKARITDKDRCIECGACANNCQYEALSVDAGVGCATAIIYGMLQGTEPDCSCCE
ncbi:MAG: mercury methylation ferredoxin HgcB [Candidatus Aminicenantaceae bacterium]